MMTLVTIAAATMAARLPFLLRADRFFDPDEAVEGLMEVHLRHAFVALPPKERRMLAEEHVPGAGSRPDSRTPAACRWSHGRSRR